jgi:hypothetical protein
VELAISLFPCQLVQYPIKYLGTPLSIAKLPKASLQPLVDKMADKLPLWKGNIMNHSGRLALIKTTLIAMTFYTTICIKLLGWLLCAVDKFSKDFMWIGSDEVWGSKCLLAWGRVKCHLQLGGLGILDLRRFDRALQVLWLWLRRVDPARPWVGLSSNKDEASWAFFLASTYWVLGNGRSIPF